MKAHIMLLAFCASACSSSRQSAVARTVASTGTPPSCHDASSLNGFVCSDSSVWRRGDSLWIRLTPGQTIDFVDQSTGEASGGFTYMGRFGRPQYHVVQSNGHEAVPSYILIHPTTGRRVEGVDSMTWSPDSTRIATVAEGWDNCSEGGGGRLTVWRLTDTLPIREYDVAPWQCTHTAAWAPTDPHWESSDVLDFTRVDFPRSPHLTSMVPDSLWVKRAMKLVLRSGQWTATR